MCILNCFGCCAPPPPPKRKERTWRRTDSLRNREKLIQASSPSKMTTTDITYVFEIPSPDYKTAEEAVYDHGFEVSMSEVLGRGGFAQVVKAKRRKDEATVAVKIMDISGKSANKLKTDAKNELFVLQKALHPHVIPIYFHCIIHLWKVNKNFVYIFMRYADNGSLSDHIRQVAKKGLAVDVSRRMFAQMASAVDFMHRLGIAHRDLKLGNILLDRDMNAMVADFGLSRVGFRKIKGTIKSMDFKGTVTYMAPEILAVKIQNRGTDDGSETSERSTNLAYNTFFADVWALGAILYAMVNRKYLFDVDKENNKDITIKDYEILYNQQKNFEKNNSKVEYCRFWTQQGVRCPEYVDLIKRIFVFDPEKRIKMSEICEHIWIKSEIDLINDKIRAEPPKQFDSVD